MVWVSNFRGYDVMGWNGAEIIAKYSRQSLLIMIVTLLKKKRKISNVSNKGPGRQSSI